MFAESFFSPQPTIIWNILQPVFSGGGDDNIVHYGKSSICTAFRDVFRPWPEKCTPFRQEVPYVPLLGMFFRPWPEFRPIQALMKSKFSHFYFFIFSLFWRLLAWIGAIFHVFFPFWLAYIPGPLKIRIGLGLGHVLGLGVRVKLWGIYGTLSNNILMSVLCTV